MKRGLTQAWDLAQGNETCSLNTAGDASPNQRWSAYTSKKEEKMKLSPSLMLKHQETINLQTSGKDFFPPPLLNQIELHQQAGARKESHGEE